MAATHFVYNYSPGKLEEFVKKLQNVGVPDKVDTGYPKSIGFGSSHARTFPQVLKYAGLLDPSGAPNDVYKKGLRGGAGGRKMVGAAIRAGYKPFFDVYANANAHPDADLITLVKSNSNLDDDKAKLVVKTFKILCEFGDFDGADSGVDDDIEDVHDDDPDTNGQGKQRRRAGGGGNGVIINVNIALSVDATSDPAVYDAFFSAMATHLRGLVDGGS